MKIYLALAISLSTGMAAAEPDRFNQIAIHCKFSEIPPVVFSYAHTGQELTGAMTVGGRGPVVMTLGSGTLRFEGGRIDGYRFRWTPQNSWMDVEKDGELIMSGQGDCQQVAFGSTNSRLKLD